MKTGENSLDRRSPRAALLVPALAAAVYFAGCTGTPASGQAGAEPAAADSRHAAAPAPQAGAAETPDMQPPEEAGPGERVFAGDKFPVERVQVIEPGKDFVTEIDLAQYLGKKPLVFVYFIPGYSISEQITVEMMKFIDAGLRDKVVFFPVVHLRPDQGLPAITDVRDRLGLDAPVIVDSEDIVKKTVAVGVAPHITLVDSEGYVDFVGASSLKQPILGDVDVRKAITIASRGQEPPTVHGLIKYHPAADFVGQQYRDMELPDYKSGQLVRIGDHVKAGRVTVLFYWGTTCRYSKREMPGMVAAYRDLAAKGLDIISVVRDGTEEAVEAFVKADKIPFPIVRDPEGKFTGGYRVVSTPTLIFIRPDGVIDSVYTSGVVNFYSVVAARVKALLAAKPAAG